VDRVASLCTALEAQNKSVGISVMGKSQCGKSTAIRAAATMRKMSASPVKINFLNQKSVTMSELYGSFDNGGNFTDGIFMKMLREDGVVWVVFDALGEPICLESLHTLLDGNRTYCSMTGENINPRDGFKLIVETEHCNNLSPAFISRMFCVNLETVFSVRGAVMKLLSEFPRNITRTCPRWKEIILTFVDRMEESPTSEEENTTHCNRAHARKFVTLVVNLLTHLFGPEAAEAEEYFDEGSGLVCAYAFMWTSSGHLTGAQRLKFLLRHKELLQKYMPALVDLPDNSLAYELLLVRCKRMDSRAQLEAVRPDKSPRTVLQTPAGLFVGTPETDAILFLLSANSQSHYLV